MIPLELLLASLTDRGLTVEVAPPDRLLVGPANLVTEELAGAIRALKPALLGHFGGDLLRAEHVSRALERYTSGPDGGDLHANPPVLVHAPGWDEATDLLAFSVAGLAYWSAWNRMISEQLEAREEAARLRALAKIERASKGKSTHAASRYLAGDGNRRGDRDHAPRAGRGNY